MAGVNGSLEEARAVMIGVFAVTAILVYAVARSFGVRRQFAGLAVLLFAFSPLSLHFQRMVLLDNLATPFVLAGFALAATRRFGLWSQAGAAICLAAGMAIIAAQHAPLRHSRRSIPLHPDLPLLPALCPPKRRTDPGIGPRQPLRGAALATL